jgi:hypothetical protein
MENCLAARLINTSENKNCVHLSSINTMRQHNAQPINKRSGGNCSFLVEEICRQEI